MGQRNAMDIASALLERQKKSWPLLATNYRALEDVKIKTVRIQEETVRVQYNPARILSSNAKVEPHEVRQRPCFLCLTSLPAAQEKIAIHPLYWLLCNPYPIFQVHFTLPYRYHRAQRILPYFADFLRLSKNLSGYTLFYNGPRCGASLPDHQHFQAVMSGEMPLEAEVERKLKKGLPIVKRLGTATLYWFSDSLRSGFVLLSSNSADALRLFESLYHALPLQPLEGDEEPKMNLFANYKDRQWRIIIVPRRAHRPRQYWAMDETHFLTSPGAADIGGLFVVPRQEDFAKVTPALLQDIYGQVCWGRELMNVRI